jgi:HlyD family secretion protein
MEIMRKKTGKIIVSGIIAMLLLIVAVSACKKRSNTNQNTWETVTVTKGNITNIVTCTGTLEPITEVEVGTQVSGRVEKIYVDYNSVVKKGQLLAELDQTVLAANLSSAESTMASAKSEMEYQEKNFERYKILYDKKLVSGSDFESAQYAYEKAKNDYSVSRNNYQSASTNLSYAKIYSPIDGVVLSRKVEEGQTVAASFSTPTLFTIANDLTKMRVIANVDEADIGNVTLGQRVTFTVDAYPNVEFQGDVTEVRQAAIVTNNVVTYEVVINAPNPELKLKPGLTATVSIYTLEKNNVLTIPSEALEYIPANQSPKPSERANGKHIVWILNGNNPAPGEIEIGSRSNVLVEVVSGLAEGEKVIVGSSSTAVKEKSSSKNDSNGSPFMPKPPSRRGNNGGAPR